MEPIIDEGNVSTPSDQGADRQGVTKTPRLRDRDGGGEVSEERIGGVESRFPRGDPETDAAALVAEIEIEECTAFLLLAD